MFRKGFRINRLGGLGGSFSGKLDIRGSNQKKQLHLIKYTELDFRSSGLEE